MGSGYLFGWDETGEDWVKVLANPSGELLIDASLILEDVPSDGELEKAPTSNWAYDHKADAAAHHAKYTDANSRAATNDIMDSSGKVIRDLSMGYHKINNCKGMAFWERFADNYIINWTKVNNDPNMWLTCDEIGVGWSDFNFYIYDGVDYQVLVREDHFQTFMALYLEEAPTDGVVNKAPTSNWAFDHNANASAHHAKYTNLEAQQACNLDGDLYHSMAGTNFRPTNPDVDDHHYGVAGILTSDRDGMSVYAPVMLPDGATVTACLVDGTDGLNDEYWSLYQIAHSDQTVLLMGQATVQTEDTSISNDVIDNSLYSYIIAVVSMDTTDILHYARIKYTL